MTVFLVDDEAPVRKVLTRLLRSAGFDVQSFATAEELLRALRPHAGPCCLVTDLCLPGLSGFDLQARLRSCGIEWPIVFISGRADVGSAVQAMKDGAVDFLEKPVSLPQLVPVIQD